MNEKMYFVAIDQGGSEKNVFLTDAAGVETINTAISNDKHLAFTGYKCEDLSDTWRVWIRNNQVRSVRVWEEKTERKVASNETEEVGTKDGVRS